MYTRTVDLYKKIFTHKKIHPNKTKISHKYPGQIYFFVIVVNIIVVIVILRFHIFLIL